MAKTKNIKIKPKDFLKIEEIIQDSDPIIREISSDVLYPLSKEDAKIIGRMIEYVRSSQDPKIAEERNLRPAYGISAIQLGFPKKLIFVRIESEFNDKKDEFALVNPKIVFTSNSKAYLSSGEGCLSVSQNVKGYVVRSYHIKIRAIDYFTDREIEIEAKGIAAIVLQHEMDHLLGILFYDRINKLEPYKIPPGAIRID